MVSGFSCDLTQEVICAGPPEPPSPLLRGNHLSADEQFAKLRLVAHTARTARGQAA